MTKKLNQYLHRLDCIGTMFVLPAAVALVLYWNWMQPQGIQAIAQTQSYVAQPSDEVYIPPPVVISSDTSQASYDIWIEDEYGSRIFTYPRFMFKRSSGADPNSLRIKFPTNMLPGHYTVRGTLFIPINPIHTSEIPVEFATVDVR